MNIIFYKLQDEVNDVKKTRTLTATSTYTPLTISGKLRSSTSKIAPVIDFAQDITYFNTYNYAYIADFGRYYFVDNVVSVRENVTSISFRVDVLTSFLTQSNMGNLEGFVSRCNNVNLYNKNIVDNRLQFRNIPIVYESSTTQETGVELREFNTTGNYNVCFTILSRGSFNDENDTEIPDYLSHSHFYNDTTSINHVITGRDIERTYSTDAEGAGWIIDQCINGNTDFKDYVLSIVAFPFYTPRTRPVTRVTEITYKISDGSSAKQISVPTTIDITREACSRYSEFIAIDYFRVGISDIDNFTDDIFFMKSNKFIKTEYYIPYYGWIELDTPSVYGHYLVLYYNIDYCSGSSMVTLYDKTFDKIVFSSSCQLGVKIPVSKSNQYELEANRSSYTANYVSSLLISGVSVVAGAVTENPYLVAGGVTGAIGATGRLIANEFSNIPKAQANVNDDHTSLFTPQKPRIRFTYFRPVIESSNLEDYRRHEGVPTNRLSILNNIINNNVYHTYAEITDLHTTSEAGTYSIDDITIPETEELKTLCSQGIYL